MLEMLIQMHMADTVDAACEALSRGVCESLPVQCSVIAFTPMSYRRFIHIHPYSEVLAESVNLYAERLHLEDLWLQRTPFGPKFTCMRHSDYTTDDTLKASQYYKQCLAPVGVVNGASLTVWSGEIWLATLTAFKSAGDFTNEEMGTLKLFHPHFDSIVKKFSKQAEIQVEIESLQNYIQSSPTAFILLSWDLSPVHINQAARWGTWELSGGDSTLKPERHFVLPDFVRQYLNEIKADLLADRRSPQTISEIVGREEHTQCRISFLPGNAGSFHPGCFLLTIIHSAQVVSPHAAKLTKAELAVYQLVCQGLCNKDIAVRLSKSVSTIKKQIHSIASKLNVRSRSQIMSVLNFVQ